MSQYEFIFTGNPSREVPLGTILVVPMPTAIVIAYTDEGFVAVSDGLATNKSGTTNSDAEQKIFPIRSASYQLVLGVSGAASLLEKNEKSDISPRKDIFKKIFCDTIEQLNCYSFSTLTEYSERFVSEVRTKVIPYLTDDIFSDISQKLEVRLVFAGYFNAEPSLSDFVLSLSKGVCGKIDESGKHRRRVGKSYIIGSIKVALSLIIGKEFAEFSTPDFEKIYYGHSDLSLLAALVSAKNYISACETPSARDLCDYCKSIGGDKSVATITPSEGFKWVEQPKKPYCL